MPSRLSTPSMLAPLLAARAIACSEVTEQGMTRFELPGFDNRCDECVGAAALTDWLCLGRGVGRLVRARNTTSVTTWAILRRVRNAALTVGASCGAIVCALRPQGSMLQITFATAGVFWGHHFWRRPGVPTNLSELLPRWVASRETYPKPRPRI
jgi:hypothetical protein